MSMTGTEYTAQDYRQMVCDLENNLKHGMERVVIASPKLIDMVRQAAETRERCERLLNPCRLEDAPCVPGDDGYCDSCDVPKHNELINYILSGDAGKGGKMICAECGKEIKDGEDYLFVADNFLQTKYFDTTEECIFCSAECLCVSLSVETITKGAEAATNGRPE